MKKILVIGSINKDISLYVKSLPSLGETLLANNMKESFGGKGANQAVTIAKMNGNVSFAGAVGDDLVGEEIISFMKKEGVDTSAIKRSKLPTGTALITVDENSDNNIIVYPGANYSITKEDIDDIDNLIDESDFILMQFEIPMETIEYVIEKAREKEKYIILNPAPYSQDFNKELLKKVDLFIPNETEFLELMGKDTKDNHDIDWYKGAAKEFYDKYKTGLIITLGSLGSLYYGENESFLVEANKVKAVDSTAAGDSYIGALVYSLSINKTLKESMTFASKVAAITISRKGAMEAIPYIDEIKE